MKIAVVGPGALGCLVAGFLKMKTGEEVWLLDRSPERAKKMSQDGITIEGLSGNHSVKVDATADTKDIGKADLVIICVKSYSTEEACKDIKDIVTDDTSVLTLQNGIGNIQILDDHFGSDRVMAGVTNHGSTFIGTGHVRHAGKGDTILGRVDGKLTVELKNVANVMTRAGFSSKTSKDIDSVIWSKLVINVGINALTAITRLNNGKLVAFDEARGLLRSAVQEAARVVKRKRIKLLYDDPIQKVESVAKATATNVSSMLQDVLNKKRTEIDFINGAVTRHGKAAGIPTPVNDMLTALVKTIEKDYEESK